MHRLPEVMLLPDSDSVTEDDVERLLLRVPGSKPGKGQLFPSGDRLQPSQPGVRRQAQKSEVLEQEALKTEKEAGDGSCWIRWEGRR